MTSVQTSACSDCKQCFVTFFGKFEDGQSGCIFAHIFTTTQARDSKIARAVVQRLYLAMVSSTQNQLLEQ